MVKLFKTECDFQGYVFRVDIEAYSAEQIHWYAVNIVYRYLREQFGEYNYFGWPVVHTRVVGVNSYEEKATKHLNICMSQKELLI